MMLQRIIIALVAIAALVGGVWIYQTSFVAEPEYALVYEPSRSLQPFELQGSQGDPVHNEDLQGQWTLLFTGYTYCPDICPTTMAQLRDALPDLQAATSIDVRVWMISVDPKRDDVERLNQYTGFFGEEFFGVRAEHPELYPFVRDLGLMYSFPDEDETDYLVNHSGAIILVNPQGLRHAIFNSVHRQGQYATVDMERLIQDFEIISARY